MPPLAPPPPLRPLPPPSYGPLPPTPPIPPPPSLLLWKLTWEEGGRGGGRGLRSPGGAIGGTTPSRLEEARIHARRTPNPPTPFPLRVKGESYVPLRGRADRLARRSYGGGGRPYGLGTPRRSFMHQPLWLKPPKDTITGNHGSRGGDNVSLSALPGIPYEVPKCSSINAKGETMLFRGMLVGAASGKLGAMVASHNKGGQYLRARTVPSGSVASAAQAIVRNAVASLSAAWSNELTDEQRAGWGEYALNVPGTNALGDSIQLSGQNWYIACNTPRLQAEVARIDDAPTSFDRGTPTVNLNVAALTDAGGTITFGGTVTGTMTAFIYQGHTFSAGRNKYYGSFQICGSVDIAGSASQVAFTPTFPVATAGNKTAFKVAFSQADGRLSTPLGVTFQP